MAEVEAEPGSAGGMNPVSLAPFISKLYEILSTATPADCIKWGAASDTIVVTDQAKFAREVLPRYFKHDNIRSFIRQLNIYGFQRCRNPERAGSVEGEHGELEFYHENFLEGRKDLMRLITRGMPSHKRRPSGSAPGDPGTAGGHAPAAPPTPTGGALQPAPGGSVGISEDAQSLANEMDWVQHHIEATDAALRVQAQHVQEQMATLVDALNKSSMPPPPELAQYATNGEASPNSAAAAALVRMDSSGSAGSDDGPRIVEMTDDAVAAAADDASSAAAAANAAASAHAAAINAAAAAARVGECMDDADGGEGVDGAPGAAPLERAKPLDLIAAPPQVEAPQEGL